MKILITNDDSIASPFFDILVKQASKIGEVVCVVPAEEQSWTGKSMSRFGALRVEEIEDAAVKTYKVYGGTPADCTNLGAYRLCGDSLPDVVFSGINIGYNCGVSFFFGSGTVGACIEASIAGIPSVSFSRKFTSELYHSWTNSHTLPVDYVAQADKDFAEVFSRLQEKLFLRADFLQKPLIWDVELPDHFAEDWQVKSARSGLSFYRDLFDRGEDGLYRHRLKGVDIDTAEDADVNIIESGHVSVACLDIRQLGQKLPNL